MKIKSIIASLLCVAQLIGASVALAEADEMIILQKRAGEDFTVLNLSDPQIDVSFTDDENENSQHFRSTVEQLVERVKPDLITISGDLCGGDLPVYKYLAEYINKFRIPWAIVWGNHDNERGATFVETVEREFQEYEYFTYQSGDRDLGHGNYVIGIEEEGRLVSAIIMMDTHNRMAYTDENGITDNDAWAKLLPEQLVWYEEQVTALKEQGCPSTALITHIPIYAYNEAYEAASSKEYTTTNYQESFDPKYWNVGYEGSFGIKGEGICSYPEDEGAMDLIEKLGSTKLVLCGHDHVNAFSIPYRGTRLMYALKTDRGSYHVDHMNGGTEIKFSSDGAITAQHIFITEYREPASTASEFDKIIAIYDDNSKLVDVQIQNDAYIYDGQKVEVKFDVPADAKTGWFAKIMLWNSLTGMMPIGTSTIEID